MLEAIVYCEFFTLDKTKLSVTLNERKNKR